MKQMLVDFVNPFVIGDGKTQFALVATAIDSELYGTGFHNQQDRWVFVHRAFTTFSMGALLQDECHQHHQYSDAGRFHGTDSEAVS